jgi:hypothetical protein
MRGDAADAGSTISFVVAVPAVWLPDSRKCRPAIVAQLFR